jgi:mRNA interferase MazF
MSKKFDNWNEIKKNLHGEHKAVIFKERDIFWVSIGINIGYEQDGKGEIFSRPVVIVKKYNNNLFFGVPLSTTIREGSFFFSFDFNNEISSALLVQGRVYDAKRLENKIGMISKNDFESLKSKLKGLLNV